MNITKAITLDLGGKTLSGNNGDDQGLLNASADLIIKNGKVTTDAGACLLVMGADVTVEKTARLIATDEAAALVAKFASGRLKKIFLAHLSEECNAPRIAQETMRAELVRIGRGDIELEVL